MTIDSNSTNYARISLLNQIDLATSFVDRDVASILVRLNRATGFDAISRRAMHDLRNPLQAITMAAGMIAESGAGGPDPGALGEIILKAAQQMEAILKRISRPPAGVGAEAQPLVVSEIVQEVTRMQQGNPSKKEPTIDVRIPQDIPSVLVIEDQLRQALLNLVLNAREAIMDSHGTMVVLTAEQNGECVDLSVEDDGPGLSEEMRENVFRPFFTTKSENGHLGLGLPVAADLAAGWGGSLELDHAVRGGGARFVLRIRAAKRSSIPRR